MVPSHWWLEPSLKVTASPLAIADMKHFRLGHPGDKSARVISPRGDNVWLAIQHQMLV